MKAHFFKDGRRWYFSGYNACGDPWNGAGDRAMQETQHRPFDAVVESDGDFIVFSDGTLWLVRPGKPGHHQIFTPTAMLLSAKLGHFGFKLIAGGKEYANG